VATTRKERIGRVISDKMDKTVIVAVETRRAHPLYKKIIRRTTKFQAHDENKMAKIGDRVKIVETRPLSKMKRWRVEEIVVKEEKAEANLEQSELQTALGLGEKK
jgi:small subunit ribosomal protein S17